MAASLTGELDLVALIQIAVWISGGLWVLVRLYPSLVKRGGIPPLNSLQISALLLTGALSLSALDSPGVLLTIFTLGQFVVTTLFAWMFVNRFGTQAFLRRMFVTLTVLILVTAFAIFFAPELVFVGSRVRGDYIAPTGAITVMAIVFCLSSVPRLTAGVFWFALAFSGAVLVVSRTRTAYVALSTYLVLGYVYGKGLRVRTLVPLLVTASLVLASVDALSSATEYVVRDPTTVITFSDRIPLWRYLTETVMAQSPFSGLGYYAASRVLAPQYNQFLGNAHSVFFEILVGGGLPAAAMYLILCGSLIWHSGWLLNTTTQRAEALTVTGLLSVCLVWALTGSDGINAGPVGFTFWSLTALIPAVGQRGYRHAPQAARGVPLFAGSRTTHTHRPSQ